jgi:quinol monooxygenase YgiN
LIIVTGRIKAKAACLEEFLSVSIEHVRRSRAEPGCVSHAVLMDVENPLRLFFFEEWEDREVLAAHFALAASRAFVRAARLMAAEPPVIEIYEASRVTGTFTEGR